MTAPSLRLTVLAGPTLPVPLPGPFAARFRSATVTENDRERSVFTLTFDAGRSGVTSAFDTPVLQGLPVRANARVVLVISFGALPQVLMDGIITQVELIPADEPGGALLRATGEDMSLALDRTERDVEHPGMEDSMQVRRILAPYLSRGILANVIPPPTMDPPLPIERTPTQHGTDLRHLQRLAAHHGYAAYMMPGPAPGTSTFYWGPPVRTGFPQPAISVDLGPDTNVLQSPAFRQDVLRPVMVEGSVQDPRLGTVVPVRTVASLRPPLAVLPVWAVHAADMRTQRLRESGVSAVTGWARAQAQTDRTSDSVVGEGVLDGARYGSVLRPRGLIGVRGAGWSHDGLWYVEQVRHDLSRGNYRQSFTIAREGYGSTVPAVRV